MKVHECRFCKKRYVGCHAHCETYISIKANNDAERAEEQRQKFVSSYKLRSNGVIFSGRNPRR